MFGTFCCRACSRESFFICSFLKLAVSAVPSELALARTWAISSLALWDAQRKIHGVHSRWKIFSLLVPIWLQGHISSPSPPPRTCPVSPQHGFSVSGIAAPPASLWPDTPERTSLTPLHSVPCRTEKDEQRKSRCKAELSLRAYSDWDWKVFRLYFTHGHLFGKHQLKL